MERHPLRWWALAVAILAVLVDMVDNQIVSVALPTIKHELGTGDAALQWISAGYALGFAVTLIIGGRLGDRYGIRRLFVLGMTWFTVSSAIAGFAPSVEVLIGARLLQGIGSGLMVPQVLSFIFAEFAEHERPKAMTLFAAAFPIGGVAGPILGGVLTEANLFGVGWRAIFLVNVPIGIIALAGALSTMPKRPGFARRRIDLTGAALLALGLAAIFYPLVQGRELGWPAWSIGVLIAAIPILAIFALQQRRAARHGGEPLIPAALLKFRSLTGGQLVLFCVNMAVGVFFVLTLHLQLGIGLSPLKAALTVVPATVGIVLGNVVAMKTIHRGRVVAALSVVLLLVSLAAIAALVAGLGAGLNSWALLGPLVGFGAGMGGTLGSLFALSTSEVRPDQAGAASGLVNTTVQLGSATGIALFGTVFFAKLGNGGTIGDYVPATSETMIVSCGVLIVGLLLIAILPKRQTPPPQPRTPRSPATDPADPPTPTRPRSPMAESVHNRPRTRAPH
ncbi:MAG TPA: MFS transporter [Pseudonocardiaceae bacterium]|nr:MFS transporter [Pseudonocardiaceae bacterium]